MLMKTTFEHSFHTFFQIRGNFLHLDPDLYSEYSQEPETRMNTYLF